MMTVTVANQTVHHAFECVWWFIMISTRNSVCPILNGTRTHQLGKIKGSIIRSSCHIILVLYNTSEIILPVLTINLVKGLKGRIQLYKVSLHFRLLRPYGTLSDNNFSIGKYSGIHTAMIVLDGSILWSIHRSTDTVPSALGLYCHSTLYNYYHNIIIININLKEEAKRPVPTHEKNNLTTAFGVQHSLSKCW